MSKLVYEVPWGFFNDACQGHPPMFNVGMVLFMNQNHYVHICCAPGTETNNKAEFKALWMLLETAIKKDAKKSQVLGDSKLVNDWVRRNITAQDVRLERLLRDIKLTFQSYEWLSFSHILCELNQKVDEFFKQALTFHVGAFRLYEVYDGVQTKAMEFLL
jgi:ribonuclease HI